MAVKINCETEKGGAVQIGPALASYAVATAGDLPPPEILWVWIDLPRKPGKQVEFFFNRQTGLAVVELVDGRNASGVEFFRANLYDKDLPGRRWVAEPLAAGPGEAS